MPSQIAPTADLDMGSCWSQSPYYEERFLASTSEPPLGWAFGSTAAVSSQSPSNYQDYASPFSNSVFDELPDIGWDQTSPETTNPTTPSSPSYSHDYPPNLKAPFTSGEEAQRYPTPRLLPKPHSHFAMSVQRRLRGHPMRRVRQQSPQPSIEDGGSDNHSSTLCFTPTVPTKRERSAGMGPDLTLGVEDEDRTPDPRFDETDGEVAAGSEPYAQLIYRALKSVPSHSMVLKDIYEWFEKHTDKPQTSTSAKGWQNSIRHNLSMNGAFIKVDQIPPSEDTKKGFIWVLADSALEEGVKSTTRYRKHNLHKKSCRTEHPAPQRQISGAKGGKAAKKSAMLAGRTPTSRPKRSPRVCRPPASDVQDTTTRISPVSALEEYMHHHLTGLRQQHDERMSLLRYPFQQAPIQSYMHTPSATPTSSFPEPRLFQLSDVVGCADLGHMPLFCDDQMGVQEGIPTSQSLDGADEVYMDYHFDDVTT